MKCFECREELKNIERVKSGLTDNMNYVFCDSCGNAMMEINGKLNKIEGGSNFDSIIKKDILVSFAKYKEEQSNKNQEKTSQRNAEDEIEALIKEVDGLEEVMDKKVEQLKGLQSEMEELMEKREKKIMRVLELSSGGTIKEKMSILELKTAILSAIFEETLSK